MAKLVGETILVKNGKKVFHKKNTITNFVERATLDGNFHDQMDTNKIMPLEQWFSGCLLFDRNLTVGDVLNTNMPVGEFKITAQASNDAYSGANIKRGSRDNNNTRPISDGYQWCWEWTQGEGNGDIGAVALTRANNGAAYMGNIWSEIPLQPDRDTGVVPCIENMMRNDIFAPPAPPATPPEYYEITYAVNCIDWDKEMAYVVSYDYNEGLGTISIKGYRMNTKQLRLMGAPGLINSTTPLVDISFDSNIDLGQTSGANFTYTGDYFFVMNSDSNTLNIVKISATDWTHTISAHNLSDGGGVKGTSYHNTILPKDCIPMIYEENDGGTVTEWKAFVIQNTGENALYVQWDLLTDTVVNTYERPDKGVENDYHDLLPCYILPNGDFFRNNTGHDHASYYSMGEDKFYAVYSPPFEPETGLVGFMGCGYNGTVVVKMANGGQPLYYLVQFFLNISTINNLDSLVTKTPSDVMQLIYRIHEVEEEEPEEEEEEPEERRGKKVEIEKAETAEETEEKTEEEKEVEEGTEEVESKEGETEDGEEKEGLL